MGIMSVKNADEVRELNRKQRNKMAVVKEGLEVHRVLVQEGVRTIERVQNGVAEPVVYMMDRYVVGGFYRIHGERGTDENLNAPGMQFEPLPFASPSSPLLANPPPPPWAKPWAALATCTPTSAPVASAPAIWH
jgi:glutamate--cysteine ligase